MTTTTKVFVILVCLFALIFTPLAIQFAARTYNWRQLAEGYRDQAETADAQARSALAVGASEAAYYQDLLKAEHARTLAGEQRTAELQRAIDKLTQDRDELARSRDNWETSARLLTAEMTARSQHAQSLSEAKEKAQGRERELQAYNLQLNDRVEELSANLVVLNQQLNQRLQEITGYRDENRTMREQLKLGTSGGPVTAGPAPAARAATPAATSPITGEVTAVREGLVTVNVGSASGVREGLQLVVLRSNDYICDLQVTANVTPNEAVARVLMDAGRQVRPGDQIVDAGSFEARR